jgi:hypothetical protein
MECTDETAACYVTAVSHARVVLAKPCEDLEQQEPAEQSDAEVSNNKRPRKLTVTYFLQE